MTGAGFGRETRVEAESNAEELPLSSITTVEQLAESLRRLHLRAGERSLRELERWAREQQLDHRVRGAGWSADTESGLPHLLP